MCVCDSVELLVCCGGVTCQDSEEISSVELADAVEQMWQKRRYHELFYMVDTCQSESMFQLVYSPGVLAVGSSQVGEDSLSHHVDPAIGVYIIDRYTYYALEFLESTQPDSQHTMQQFLKVHSRFTYRDNTSHDDCKRHAARKA